MDQRCFRSRSINNGNGPSSASPTVVAAFRDAPRCALHQRGPGGEAVPHLTAERFGAFTTKPEDTPTQRRWWSLLDALIAELKSADVSCWDSMSQRRRALPLKAYSTHLARAA